MKIQGQIDVNSLSLNSGEDGVVALNEVDIEAGLRVVVFSIRSVSFEEDIHKAVNKVLLDKEQNNINKNELIKLEKNPKLQAFLRNLPSSCSLKDFGVVLNPLFKNNYGITGVLYKYNNDINILIHDVNTYSSLPCSSKSCEAVRKGGYKGIVYKKDLEYFTFTDKYSYSEQNVGGVTANDGGLICKNNSFVRIISNNIKIYYINNKIDHIDTLINSKLINEAKISIVRNKKYGSFDIECGLDEKNKFVPVSCGWYTSFKEEMYFVKDYTSSDEMFKQCFSDMFEEAPNYTWYTHNLSGFDSVFMIKTLLREYPNTKLNYKEGKPFNIKSILKNEIEGRKNKSMVFKDSYKLLPMSLKSLIKAYKVETQKLLFPYSFLKLDNLDYCGPVPSMKYYEGILKDDYIGIVNSFKDNNWDLKHELIKYMRNDIVALYEVIDLFSKEMFDLENLDITSVSSLSSTALKTFLSNYYKEDKTPIHIPKYKNYIDLRQGFYGGRVEVFNSYGENLFMYDVVSLYPSVMKKPMPIGNLTISNDTNINNYFGFCYASVNVPRGIRAPILPFRKEYGGLCYPTGNWTAWFSSEILKEARDKQNVKIQVHNGYKQKSSNEVFSKYIDNFSEIKIKAEKDNNNARRTVAKLMLNSLYGRFGLKYEPYTIDFVSAKEAAKIAIEHEILENIIIDEDNDIEFIKYTTAPSQLLKEIDKEKYFKLTQSTNIDGDFVVRSLPISAMTTSYGAIVMNSFLNIADNPCYYTDTDSLFLEKPLDDKYVGKELGKLSFKGKIKRAYFISPKTYCLVMDDDKVIIKSKGIKNSLLNEDNFKELLLGKSVNIETSKIYTTLKKINAGIKHMNVTIKPENINRLPIYNNGIIENTIPYHVEDGLLQPMSSSKPALKLSGQRRLWFSF